MHPLPSAVDCLVVGAGPAGAALAGLLVRGGTSTLLVDDGALRQATAVETLLPAALSPLERCGLAAVVRAATTTDRRRHGARWDSEGIVWRDDARPGLCLRRGAFDDHLRAWAVAGGAVLARPARIRALPAAGTGEVAIELPGRSQRVHVRAIAVATGRRAATLLAGARAVDRGPPTAAFAFTAPAAADHRELAMVVATADGWCWWIGDDDGTANVVVTIDARTAGARVRAVVDRVLAAAGGPAATLVGVRPRGAVRATLQSTATTRSVLLCGDAAATLDPLASQGTEKALVGAEAAALALRTALADPALRPLAFDHHARWEHALHRAHRATAAGFYARVQRYADQPFWRARSLAMPRTAAPTTVPGVLCAARALRQSAQLERRGDLLVPIAGFAVGDGEPVSRIGRVAVAPILAAFATPTPSERAIAAAGQDPQLFALGSAAVRAAVLELWRRGLLTSTGAD